MTQPAQENPFDEGSEGPGTPGPSASGSGWTSEAERIVEGVQHWLVEAAQGAHGGLDTGAPTCGVCPLCRAVSAVRTADPALLAAGLEVATTAALAMADVLKRAADDLMDLVAHPGTPSTDEGSK